MFLGFYSFFFYEDQCRQTQKCDPKASEICIPWDSYSSVHISAVTEGKMKEINFTNHNSDLNMRFK